MVSEHMTQKQTQFLNHLKGIETKVFLLYSADYTDGSRKEWQPYSSMAAAAYMKTLIMDLWLYLKDIYFNGAKYIISCFLDKVKISKILSSFMTYDRVCN